MITFYVDGTPAPQGSKRHVGRGIMLETSKNLPAWREAITAAARRVHEGKDPIDEPVEVTVAFYMPRPKKPKFDVPAVAPDLDKLQRAVGDALQISGVLKDDSRIVSWQALKVYGDRTGAQITIAPAPAGAISIPPGDPMTRPWLKPAYIGLDIETTGLSPQDDVILEIGVMVFSESLYPLSYESVLIEVDKQDSAYLEMSDYVTDMHTTSGLLKDLETGETVSLHEAEQHLIDWISNHTDEQLPMLGSSISFDRSFLAVHMPRLLEKFHHRSLDATSVKYAALCAAAFKHPEAETIISEDSESFTGFILNALGPSDLTARHHRPIYDLCQSAGLIQASISFIRSLG